MLARVIGGLLVTFISATSRSKLVSHGAYRMAHIVFATRLLALCGK
jgi:hypothetical protein